MTKTLKLATLLLCASLATGCAVKSGNEKLEDSTNESIGKMIIKDKTTKSNVKELLGEPQKVDFLSNGLEKWEYSHLRKASKGVNYIPVANWFVGGTNDTTKTLVILFEGDVVKNYTTAVAEGETKAGLFQ
jgi:outer membrane protein assembly factor BamE (lipoprotein component of BamABCDE complex)